MISKRYMKKLYAFLLALALSMGITTSASANLDRVFGDLLDGAAVATQNGGSYESQARNSYVFGGIGIRFPRSNVQLFSITPPRVTAGCNGIDFFLGGFSFINGEQFTALLRNIGQSALGYVVQLALKQLCPQCEAVIAALQKAAQLARKASVDSCEAGTALGAFVAESIGLGGGPDSNSQNEATADVCGKEVVGANATDGFITAMNSICDTMEKSVSWLEDLVKNDPDKQAELAIFVGNSSWQAVKALGFTSSPAVGEFMLGMFGTTVIEEDTATPLVHPPTFDDPKVAMDIFMCGAHPEDYSDIPVVQKYCLDGDVSIPESYHVYQCDEYTKCLHPQKVSVADWKNAGSMGDRGFIAMVYEILMGAVDDAAQGKKLSDEAIALIQSSPIPLYKAINIAAVYPSVAESMVETNTLMISFMLADSYFRFIITEAYRQNSASSIPGDLVKRVLEAATRFNEGMSEKIVQIDNLLVRQQRFMSQINQINNVMQNQVFSRGLMGNQVFVKDLSSAVAGH